MRPLDLMVDGLADIMQQARAFGKRHVCAELGGHDARQMCNFDRMLEHVLAVARAVLHAAKVANQLVMQALTPTSSTAASPASRMAVSTSFFAFSTISSMRAG
jgi:hypothetical protein